jgi:hypothetical protein
MPEKFERTEAYKEGELNVTPETAEAAAERVMTPAQKEMSERQEKQFEVQGNIFILSWEHGNGISDEDQVRFPGANEVQNLSGQMKVGEKIKKIDVKKAKSLDGRTVWFAGTINDQPVPTEIAQKLYDKYVAERRLASPTDHYFIARKANEERDLAASGELWEGLL